jgi:hypothetical protein
LPRLTALLPLALLLSSGMFVSTTPGVAPGPPPGFRAYNTDPNINSTFTNQVYDPNFIPGFSAGLPNVSVSWATGRGYAKIGYQVGPLSHLAGATPHLAVGPQCCNFVEVPHTQQFRMPSWGDYYYVKAGFTPPGVNVDNFTTDFSAPAYVGLRTDWNWTVSFSIDWSSPVVLNDSNSRAAIGIVATQYVPEAPGKLVYTQVSLWMNGNSSAQMEPSTADGVPMEVSAPNLVTYHPLQISTNGNQTVVIGLSAYLRDTLRVLGLHTIQAQPPVISYVYLNVEGYNFRWNGTLWSFNILAPSDGLFWNLPTIALAGLAIAAAAALISWFALRKGRFLRGHDGVRHDTKAI